MNFICTGQVGKPRSTCRTTLQCLHHELWIAQRLRLFRRLRRVSSIWLSRPRTSSNSTTVWTSTLRAFLYSFSVPKLSSCSKNIIRNTRYTREPFFQHSVTTIPQKFNSHCPTHTEEVLPLSSAPVMIHFA
jgi:hypothetical protein